MGTTHEIPERHVVTSAYTTTHEIPERHVVTSAYNTYHQIPEQHTVTSAYTTTHQIPEQHTVTGSYNTYTSIPHTHVVTGTYNTYKQIPHTHVVTGSYTTTHEIPERHVVTQQYNSYAQVAHQHVVTGSYQVAHTSYTKVPYTTTHTKTVEVPSKAGYRRLAEDAGTTAHGLKKITKDEATTTLTKSGSLPYGYKVISTHTEEIPKYTTKTITHTAYKTVAKPYTVVSHVICSPRVSVSYQCPQCTGSSNYVAGYGADFDSQEYTPAQVSHAGYATHVYHHVYHAEGVTKSLSTDGELKWTPTADGSWKAQGHDDWKTHSANLQQAASTETAKVAHHSSAVGAVVGVSVGCVAMAVVALYVVKRRSAAQPAEGDNLSIL